MNLLLEEETKVTTKNRHKTHIVRVGNKFIGGDHPVLIQSMTNTDTADIGSTFNQVIELAEAGSEIVRLTVNNDEAAKAVPIIFEKLNIAGYNVPLVGCFHYNGHRLLTDYPELCSSLAKFRINPGNVGFGNKRDKQFEQIIELAIKYNKPVRIGVNWGSIDQDLATDLMNKNAQLLNPKTARQVLLDTLVLSTLISAQKAENIGLAKEKIILSCKVSNVQDLVDIYRDIAKQSNYALHLGLTEAGISSKGIIATTAALSLLLNEGIGDTIRASITPKPGASRTEEVKVCQEIIQSLGIRAFAPVISSCPGCGRTTSTYFQELADYIGKYIADNMLIWSKIYPGVENMTVAIMGCIVNGPGESKHANIGISLPGSGESPVAPVFVDGEKAYTLRGNNIANEFIDILNDYVKKNYTKNQTCSLIPD